MLQLLLERLKNEITRLAAVKALERIALAPLPLPLGKILQPSMELLTSFLRKASRPLRQAALAAIKVSDVVRTCCGACHRSAEACRPVSGTGSAAFCARPPGLPSRWAWQRLYNTAASINQALGCWSDLLRKVSRTRSQAAFLAFKVLSSPGQPAQTAPGTHQVAGCSHAQATTSSPPAGN